MKRIRMIASLMMLMTTTVCVAQRNTVTISGNVIEKSTGEGLCFSTVALMDGARSIIAGTMADNDGHFEIKANSGEYILCVSMVGYRNNEKSLTVAALDINVGDIIMEDDVMAIDEVVITGHLPQTQMSGDAIVTKIEGSVLEHSGNAQDILAKIPGMISREGKLEVIGRGEPVYYINGRRVLDNDELRSLMSEEIRSIDVVNNPGAAYGGDIKAVVRIKTVKRKGEGFSFALTSQGCKYLNTSHIDPSWTVLDLNYRKKGVDLIGKITYWDNHGFQIADADETSHVGQKLFEQLADMDVIQHQNGLNSRFGVNWQINDSHSLGFQLENKQMFNGHYTETMDVDVFTDKSKTDHLISVNNGFLKDYSSWNGNIYYSGTIQKMEIEFNTDFQTDRDDTETETVEKSQIEPRSMESENDRTNTLLASKLVFSHPVWKGKLQFGTEETFSRIRQKYSITFDEMPQSESEIRENSYAGFLEYALPLKPLQIVAGLRYEHVDFVFDDKMGDTDMDRSQNNLFPSLSVSSKVGPVSLSASLSGKSQRPGFWKLANNMEYHSRFVYQIGDPTLKNEKYLDCAINANWKWLSLSATYERVTDGITNWTVPYNDEGVVLMTYINLPEDINIWSGYIVASPNIGVWYPQYTLGIRKQIFEMMVSDELAPGGKRELNLNKPMYMAQLNNSFRFKKSWQFSVDYQFTSKYDYGNIQMTNPKHYLECSVQKSFLKEDALTVKVSAIDILNQSHEAILLDSGCHIINQDNDYNQPTVGIRISYHFNSTASKYKGTGAGQAVKDRM